MKTQKISQDDLDFLLSAIESPVEVPNSFMLYKKGELEKTVLREVLMDIVLHLSKGTYTYTGSNFFSAEAAYIPEKVTHMTIIEENDKIELNATCEMYYESSQENTDLPHRIGKFTFISSQEFSVQNIHFYWCD